MILNSRNRIEEGDLRYLDLYPCLISRRDVNCGHGLLQIFAGSCERNFLISKERVGDAAWQVVLKMDMEETNFWPWWADLSGLSL